MTFQIPVELEPAIRDAVQGGRFASVDEAMTEAVRLLARELKQEPITRAAVVERPDLFTGSMRDHAEEIEEIVTDIYRRREAESWRTIDVE